MKDTFKTVSAALDAQRTMEEYTQMQQDNEYHAKKEAEEEEAKKQANEEVSKLEKELEEVKRNNNNKSLKISRLLELKVVRLVILNSKKDKKQKEVSVNLKLKNLPNTLLKNWLKWKNILWVKC